MLTGSRFGLCTLAVLAGAGLAPFSIFLASERLPSLSTAVLYGILAFILGALAPARGWRWGLWVTLGIPMAVLLIPLAQLVGLALNVPTGSPLSFRFLWMILSEGYLPGLLGACGAGYLGAALAKLRRKGRGARGARGPAR